MHQLYTTIPGYAHVHVQTNMARLRKQVKDGTATRQEAEVCINRSILAHDASCIRTEVCAHDFALLIVADRISQTITPFIAIPSSHTRITGEAGHHALRVDNLSTHPGSLLCRESHVMVSQRKASH
jgi:hypothetical protein